MTLGENLRAIRKKRGYTLQYVAEKTGYSASLISQVERNLVNPSIATLKNISKVLDMPLFAIFDEDKFEEVFSQECVVRREQRVLIGTGDYGSTFSLINPYRQRKMDIILIEAEPGGMSGTEFPTHPGEECEVVLQGTMEVEWNNSIYTLHEGDSIYIDSSIPHRWRNPSSEKLVVLCSLTPANF